MYTLPLFCSRRLRRQEVIQYTLVLKSTGVYCKSMDANIFVTGGKEVNALPREWKTTLRVRTNLKIKDNESNFLDSFISHKQVSKFVYRKYLEEDRYSNASEN